MNGCVYIIRCVPTGDAYVGESVQYDRRRRQHLGRLAAGRHLSERLQECYNKHGRDALVFEVLQRASCKRSMVKEEAKWMEKLRPSCNNPPLKTRSTKGKPNLKNRLIHAAYRRNASTKTFDAIRVASADELRGRCRKWNIAIA